MSAQSWTFSHVGDRCDIVLKITVNGTWQIDVTVLDKSGKVLDRHTFTLDWLWVRIFKAIIRKG